MSISKTNTHQLNFFCIVINAKYFESISINFYINVTCTKKVTTHQFLVQGAFFQPDNS